MGYLVGLLLVLLGVGVYHFGQSGFLPQIAPCLEHFCAGGGGGSVSFEVFYMCLVYTPEGIILANGILQSRRIYRVSQKQFPSDKI